MQSSEGQSSEAESGAGTDVTGEVDIDPTTIVERLDAMVDGLIRAVPNIGIALVVLLAAWGLGKLAGRMVRRAAARRERHDLGDVLGGFIKAGVTLFGFAIALTILAPSLSIGSLVSSLGIGSVAIGFAFKDILQNWLAGLLILIRQPFHVGDQIVVKNFEGTVQHIETRATLIRTYDGQRIVIPNADVYTNAVTVRTAHDTRRSQWDVGVGYSADIREACRIAERVMAETDGVLADPPPEALPWEFSGSSVNIRLRWWTESLRSTVVRTTSSIVENLKAAYDEARIDIPYQTSVVLLHDQTDERDGTPGSQFEGWPAPKEGKVRSVRELRADKAKGKSESEPDKTTF